MDSYDPKRDLYVVLGVADDATAEDIKQTHRRKIKLVHPDGHRSPELATRETAALNAARRSSATPRVRRAARRVPAARTGSGDQAAQAAPRSGGARDARSSDDDARAKVKARTEGVRAKVAAVRAKAKAKPSTVKATAIAKPAERTPGPAEQPDGRRDGVGRRGDPVG